MSEVGALIVSLKAETAQFRSDLGKVKADLDNLKGGAESAGSGIDFSMTKARGSLMLMENAVGVRLPRALNGLIASIPGVGVAFQAMLPIAGVLVAIEVVSKLVDAHEKLKEKMSAVKTAQAQLGAGIAEAMSGLEAKLLQSGIHVDELRKNHIAALKKELELIDLQSMSELEHTFDGLASKADAVFATMASHWYQFGNNSSGAKKSLQDFQSQYELTLATAQQAQGKADAFTKGSQAQKDAQANANALSAKANKMLDDKVAREERILALQQKGAANEGTSGFQTTMRAAAQATILQLTGRYVDMSADELKSQQALVDVLHAQVSARQTIAATAASDKVGAKLGEAKRAAEEGNKAMEQQLALQRVILAGTDAHIAAVHKLAQTNAEAALAAQKTPEQSAESDTGQKLAAIDLEHTAAVTAANDVLAAKKRAYDAEVTAARANKAKLKEIEAQWRNDQLANTDAIAQADAEASSKTTAVKTEAKNEQISESMAATQAGYDAELRAAVEHAQNQQKIAIETAKNLEGLGKITSAQMVQAMSTANTMLANVERASYAHRIAQLDIFSKDYRKNVQKLNSEILAETTKGDQQVEQEKRMALQKQTQEVISAENRMASAIATDIAHSIVMNKSLAAAFRQTGEEMAEGMIKNLLIAEMTGNKQKLIDAKSAAANSYNWASAWGGPIAGGIAGAAAFTSVMAFANGGTVPGSGSGDTVPAMLSPGETVITRALTERVTDSERRGSAGGGGTMHMHYAPQIHAVDAKGVDDMLTKHGSVFERHINATMRRMNRR